MTANDLDLLFRGIEVTAVVGGGGFALFKLGRLWGRMAIDIESLKDETKKVGEILTTIAVQKQQIETIERRIEELRHGEGFIFPIADAFKRS